MKMVVFECVRCEGENVPDYNGKFTFMLDATGFDQRYPIIYDRFEIPEYEFCCPWCGSWDYVKQLDETDVTWEVKTE